MSKNFRAKSNKHRATKKEPRREYSEKYDAYYDPDIGEWLEPKCSDPKCGYCSLRPILAFGVTE